MNRMFFYTAVLFLLLTLSSSAGGEGGRVLSSFDVNKQLFSTELLFKFDNMPDIKPSSVEGQHCYEIIFSDVRREEMDKFNVVGRISKLPFVKSVVLERMPSVGVRIILSTDTTHVVFVRKYTDDAKFAIEVVSADQLSRLSRGVSFLEMASLGEQKPGTFGVHYLV